MPRLTDSDDEMPVSFGDIWDGRTWDIVLGEDFFVVEEKADLVRVEGGDDDEADVEHRLVIEPLTGAEARIWSVSNSWPALANELQVIGRLLGGKTACEEFAFAGAPDDSIYRFSWTPVLEDSKDAKEAL